MPKKWHKSRYDVMPNNEKDDVPLLKKLSWITENDVIEKKITFLCLKKWHESQNMTLCQITEKWCSFA